MRTQKTESHNSEASPLTLRKVKAAILLALILAGAWLFYSNGPSWFAFITGIISIAIVVIVTLRMGLIASFDKPLVIRANTYFYSLWLMWQIVISSLDVAKRIWQVTPAISPAVVRIPSHGKNNTAKALYANSITLTPGTLCMSIDSEAVEVHGVTKSAIADLKTGVMDKRVRHVFTAIEKEAE